MPSIRLRWLLLLLFAGVALIPPALVAALIAIAPKMADKSVFAILGIISGLGLVASVGSAVWLSSRIVSRTESLLAAVSAHSDAGSPAISKWQNSYVAELNELGTEIRTIVAASEQRAMALDEANAVFAATFEQSLIPLALTRPPGGVFIDVSKSWGNAFGYSKADVIGRPARDLNMFSNPADFEQLSRELAQHGVVRDYPVNIRAASGDIRQVLVSCLPLRVKQVDSVLTSMMDVTEKLAAENARLETEERYRVIVEAMAEGVVVHHNNLSVVSCNRAAEKILGVDEAQLRGIRPMDPAWKVIDADGSRMREEDYPSTIAIRTGVPCLGRHLVAIRPDGSKREISINAMPLDSASLGGRGALVTIADRTSEFESANALQTLAVTLEDKVAQRTEELEAAISELKAFSYSVSHDLRAPLRAIDGFAQLLNENHGGELSEAAKRHLDRVLQSAKRMNVIIDDLLLLSRVTQADLAYSRVDISGFAWTVVEQLKGGSDRKVDWQIDPNIEVQGDAGLLKVLLENLLGNAWKYSAKTAAARIALRTVQSSSPDMVTFMVEDNGAGFDQTYAGQLFSPFRRLHAESEFPGSGIGLATVKRVVSRHGGTVRAEGTPGQGAKFWVTLPREVRAG